jgi:hypothetical protein
VPQQMIYRWINCCICRKSYVCGCLHCYGCRKLGVGVCIVVTV